MPQDRRRGRYSPNEGLTLPSEGYTGPIPIPCPDVGDQARAWWSTWATSAYAHFFDDTEWAELAVTTVLMDKFFTDGSAQAASEARHRQKDLFGLATRARLHIRTEDRPADMDGPVTHSPRPRRDPRLKEA